MRRKIIRTTQRRVINDREAPVQTIQEREVVRTMPEVYEPSLPVVPTRDEVAGLGSRVRALESEIKSRSAREQDLDYRLTHLEEANRGWGARYAVEHATWWMLWYILMLVLGSLLIVVVTLILLSLIRTT